MSAKLVHPEFKNVMRQINELFVKHEFSVIDAFDAATGIMLKGMTVVNESSMVFTNVTNCGNHIRITVDITPPSDTQH